MMMMMMMMMMLPGDTTWFADHPENLVLLTFFLYSFFDFVPLGYQEDRIELF